MPALTNIRIRSQGLLSRTINFQSLCLLGVLATSGCGVPEFDIPSENPSAPTANTIIDRITCELVDLIRPVREDGSTYNHRKSLLAGNYQIAVLLSFATADTGQLSPNFKFPISPTFSFNIGITISEKRTHTYSSTINLSIAEILRDWENNNFGDECPKVYRNLAGELGLERIITTGLTTRNTDLRRDISKGGAFGGTIEFVVTKNLNNVGPKWVLDNFEGPGGLARAERVHTNKLTITFAGGDKTPAGVAEASARADRYIDRILAQEQIRSR